MLMAMIDVDEKRESILVVVIETLNLERMKQADPITIESRNRGGSMPAPRYPNQFSTLIAYEADEAETHRRATEGAVEFLRWLERGRKWIPGLDGIRWAAIKKEGEA